MSACEKLLRYGVAQDIAHWATPAGLGATKIRALAKKDLVEKFGLSDVRAAELKKCLARELIDAEIVDLLLTRSNHTCCICKGTKDRGIIIHHIVEYERSQDNSYSNLAVLCPNDHDRAHRPGGLSLGLTADQIRKAKIAWERMVEVQNVQRAARAIEVSDDAIDYVNVQRLEEMCIRRFGEVPGTALSASLRRKGILGEGLRFDGAFVRKHLSGGSYLFDYVNSSETEHYRQLLEKLANVIDFEDLSEAARSGVRKLKVLEGRYAYFIGGVRSRRPKLPITRYTDGFSFTHSTRKVQIVWDADPNYLMSSSSISRQGQLNRYIIYGLVRTVHRPSASEPVQVTCSPLLVAQPTSYVDRTPGVAWRRYAHEDEADEFF